MKKTTSLYVAGNDSVMPPMYRIINELQSICSSFIFSGFTTNVTASGTGVKIKNTSHSRFSFIIIKSLRVKINNTGTFTLRIIDKNGKIKDISQAFFAG